MMEKRESDMYRGLLKPTFQDFEPEPPRDIWPEVSQRIQDSPKDKNWWAYMDVAAVLIIATIWILQSQPSKPKQVIQSITHSTQTNIPTTLQPPKAVLPATRDTTVSSVNKNTSDRSVELIADNSSTKKSVSVDFLENDKIDLYVIEETQITKPQALSLKRPLLQHERIIQPLKVENSAPRLVNWDKPLIDKAYAVVESQMLSTHSYAETPAIDQIEPDRLTVEKVLFIASQELDRLVKDPPLETYREENQEVTTTVIEFQIGKLKIVRKKYDKTTNT